LKKERNNIDELTETVSDYITFCEENLELETLAVTNTFDSRYCDTSDIDPQRVRVRSLLSEMRFTHIGAPQGCVLSPVLFTIYTNNHHSDADNTLIIKYADDTAILGLLGRSPHDLAIYQETIANFVTECCNDDLKLNVKKTKEMIV